MPTWGGILQELNQSANVNNGQPDFDGVRRKYLAALNGHTGRSVLLYATDWLSGSASSVSIVLEDVHALMENVKDLPGPELDLIIHSPGGSAEAVDSIVKYLRTKYTHIRAFVPLAAMSAGTMLALSCDEIVMGKHSQIGPIDPQIHRPAEGRFVPARAIVEQWDQIQVEVQKDPGKLTTWYPIIQQYGTSLIAECERAEKLGRALVERWLTAHMFKSLDDPAAEASRVAEFFSEYGASQSHSLGISREEAAGEGVTILNLEADPKLQDLVLSFFHATMHTFQGSAVKIVENHLGRAFVKSQQQFVVPQQIQVPAP